MPSSVDEQPPSRPGRARPQPARRRPASRAKAAAPSRRSPAEIEAADAPPSRERGAGRGRDRERNKATPVPGSSRSPRTAVVLLTVVSLLVVGLGVFAIVLNTRSSKKPLAPAPTNTPVPTTTFSDPLTGFTVQYPRSWQKIAVPVANYRLAVDGGNNVAFTIRVIPIDTPATAANLENFKAVTDGLVGSNDTVSILKQQAVSLNGMLGYYYFYTFTDGGVSAVHAHYFLFSGNKMNVLVFQALPDDFATYAPTFDMIAESFRSDPNVAATPATAPSTTVP